MARCEVDARGQHFSPPSGQKAFEWYKRNMNPSSLGLQIEATAYRRLLNRSAPWLWIAGGFVTSAAVLSESTGVDHELRFELVRRPSVLGAFKLSMYATAGMMLVGVGSSIVGETFVSSPAGLAVIGLLIVVVMGFFIYKAMKQSRQEKPRFALVLIHHELQQLNPNGGLIKTMLGPDMQAQHESYLLRTKYASATFPMLRFGAGKQATRIAVWDPQYVMAGAPLGPAPEFLIGVSDWKRLQTALANRGLI